MTSHWAQPIERDEAPFVDNDRPTVRRIRSALVDYINARSKLRTASNDRAERQARRQMEWCEGRIADLMRSGPQSDATRRLVRGVVEGKGPVGELLRSTLTPESRTETEDTEWRVQAMTDAALGHADQAAKGTPGTHIVQCREHGRHVRLNAPRRTR